MFISTDVFVIIWKVLGYLCISWGMGGEGDPFQNPGGGGRSGAIYQGIKASMGYNNLNASHGVMQTTGDRDDTKS